MARARQDFARIERGETVRGVRPEDALGPPMPGCKVVAVGRTRPSPEVGAALEGADVATLAAPFMDERLEVAQSAYAAHRLGGCRALREGTGEARNADRRGPLWAGRRIRRRGAAVPSSASTYQTTVTTFGCPCLKSLDRSSYETAPISDQRDDELR